MRTSKIIKAVDELTYPLNVGVTGLDRQAKALCLAT